MSILSSKISRCLTLLVPQPLHRTVKARRFPWSEGFERMFRNEEVAGSNPASSTKRPGQGVVGASERLLFVLEPPSRRATGVPQD